MMTIAPARDIVEKKVLKRITPPSRKPAIISATIATVRDALRARQITASVVLGGSMAKGTYLAGDHDVDVFVRFSVEYPDDSLSDRLGDALSSVFRNVERVHGSRDYFHVKRGAYLFEFIPVLDVAEWKDARNVTDMSPLHVDYVAKNISLRPWLSGDIRLTKQFCKAAKIYGAESHIGGFSGHVIDLLNIHYGGFRPLLEAAASWKGKVVLDPAQRLVSPIAELNGAKTASPLIIVDPVQQDRNSSAALTRHAFDVFRSTAKEYLSSDSSSPKESSLSSKERFFTVTPLSVSSFTKAHLDCDIAMISIAPLVGKKDVVGSKCLKAFEHCVRQLLDNDFTIAASAWEFDPKKTVFLFAFPKKPLPKEKRVAGPPVHKTADVARFTQAHATTFTKDGRINAIDTRRWRDPLLLLKEIIQSTYVKERVVRVSMRKI